MKPKFKAVFDNKIYEVVEIGYNADGICDITIVDSFDGDWDERAEKYTPSIITLIRFTGLHDKNGKEIYEGNIVKISCEDAKYGNFEIQDIVKIDEKTGHYFIFEYMSKELEIIGNIYENPELIE